MKKLFIVFIAFTVGGCTTIENHYTVTGDYNRFQCDSTAAPIKTIDTGFAASAAQGGDSGSESTK